MPLTMTEEGLRVWTYANPDEFVANVCQKPGMYVGKISLELAACYFYGYDAGVRDALKRDKAIGVDDETLIQSVLFSIWLCEECFFDTYGDVVGSAAGWAHFLAWLADSDAEAFVFMPLLYHEFSAALREAAGSRALRDRLDAVKLTSEEERILRSADSPNDEEDIAAWSTKRKGARDARVNEQRAPLRALMQTAAEAATQGVDRPLAAHVAAMRAAREARKARAAALLREAEIEKKLVRAFYFSLRAAILYNRNQTVPFV